MALKRSSSKNGVKESVLPYLVFGTLFGYFLSKSRATDYDTIVNMFMFREFQLYGVIGTAIATIALGLFLLRRKKIPARSGVSMDLEPLAWDPKRLMGAFLLGVGWALAGTCPGTALAQIGEGKLMALFTVIGILSGVWVFRKLKVVPSSSKDQVC